MKLIVEIEINEEYKLKKDSSLEDKIKLCKRNFIDKIDSLITEASMDHSTYIPEWKDKRYIDLIEEITLIDIKD